MRNNLNIQLLKKLKLSVASSCDLKYFVDILRERETFEEIKYNFESGTSDDAFIEILQKDNIFHEADVVIASIAETTKKLIHPLVSGKTDIDYQEAFSNIENRLKSVIDYLEKGSHKSIFIFTYPINSYSFDINDRSWVYGSVTYWLEKLRRLYIDTLQKYGEKIDLIDLNEALADIGMRDDYYRPELTGGHPEKKGSEKLVDLFLEKLISRLDLKNKIKAIALDLDHTLWNGVFLESEIPPKIYPHRALVLHQHASKGIPICVVSKNNPEDVEKIKNLIKSNVPGLFRDIVSYYVSWQPKSNSISSMAKDLGIGIESIAFFDDNSFERGEVKFNLPEIRVYSEDEIIKSLRYAEFSFLHLSEDAKRRVESYKLNIKRTEFENNSSSSMSIEEYLESLNFKIKFFDAKDSDIDRIDELVQRTNQQNLLLNRTTKKSLFPYIKDNRAILISLQDKFGDYGNIGVILYENINNNVRIQEMAISCRALGKGVEESIVAFLNSYFSEFESIFFKYELNYKNKAFFEKLIRIGFIADESNSTMRFYINKSIFYPKWFSVEEPEKKSSHDSDLHNSQKVDHI